MSISEPKPCTDPSCPSASADVGCPTMSEPTEAFREVFVRRWVKREKKEIPFAEDKLEDELSLIENWQWEEGFDIEDLLEGKFGKDKQ